MKPYTLCAGQFVEFILTREWIESNPVEVPNFFYLQLLKWQLPLCISAVHIIFIGSYSLIDHRNDVKMLKIFQ